MLLRLIKRIILAGIARRNHIKAIWLHKKCLISVWVYSINASFANDCRFFVPVSVKYSKGKLTIGKGAVFGSSPSPMQGNGKIIIQARAPSSEVVIGENCVLSNNVSIISCESILIGNDFLCGDSVSIIDSDFHGVLPSERRTAGKTEKVSIGDNVWFGSRVMVMKGVTIGANSVIAPNSIVTSDIPENVVAGGVPAKIIKKI